MQIPRPRLIAVLDPPVRYLEAGGCEPVRKSHSENHLVVRQTPISRRSPSGNAWFQTVGLSTGPSHDLREGLRVAKSCRLPSEGATLE